MSAFPPTPEQRLAMRERPAGRAAMYQRWSALLFLHWKIDPEAIQRRLPAGLQVDMFEGSAWLGVVPFFMERVRPVGLPAMPRLSWFLELNVRTYVHDEQGRSGVWFFSLDCNQPIAVEVARRAFHLPYQHAAMKAVTAGDEIIYESRRRTRGAPVAEFRYRSAAAGEPALPGTLEWFLVERYLLFSANRTGRIFCGQVNHAPYQISTAHCERWSTEPLRLNGFPEPLSAPDSLLVAEPVDVTIFPLRPA
jgi:uncharacterized protein